MTDAKLCVSCTQPIPTDKPEPAFWMVARLPAGAGFDNTPTHPHHTLEAAHAEALRLAIKHPKARFYVMQAVCVYSSSITTTAEAIQA